MTIKPGDLVHIIDTNPNYKGTPMEGKIRLHPVGRPGYKHLDITEDDVVMFLRMEDYDDEYEQYLAKLIVLHTGILYDFIIDSRTTPSEHLRKV